MRISLKPRWRRLPMGLIGVAAITVITAWLFRTHEPVYHGNTLNHWIAEVANPNNRQEPARDVFRQIGSQAVPFLLRKARNESSPSNRIYRQAWYRLPDIVRRRVRQPESEDEALTRISVALHHLRPSAGPVLMAALKDRNAGV